MATELARKSKAYAGRPVNLMEAYDTHVVLDRARARLLNINPELAIFLLFCHAGEGLEA